MTTPTSSQEQYHSVPPMGIPTSPSRSSIKTPRTPINTPRKRNVSIRESNWRQGRSNIQSASDILRRDTIDWRRVKLPPGQKPPREPLGSLPKFPCKFCHMKHIGRICPCMKCGWIHLTLECPEIPYEAPEEEEPHYPSIPCWHCGQEGHYPRECPIEYELKESQYGEMYGPFTNGEATYPLEVDTRPQIIDGYLYRPGSGSLAGKPTSHPIKSYIPDKPSKGVPRKEKAPEKRGVDKRPTPHPQNSLKAVLEVVEEVLQVGDPQVKDPQEVVVMMRMVMMKMKIKIKGKKILKMSIKS